MVAGAKQIRRQRDGLPPRLDRRDRRAAAMRPMTGTATGRPPSSSEAVRTRPRLPSITLGVNPRERPATMPWATDFGQLDHFDGAGLPILEVGG